MKKQITTKEFSNMLTSVRLSSHEKLCAERMKQLIKAVDELKKDVKDMKADMNKWKGAGGIIILLGGLLGSVFYFFMK
jgi:tetrahydromethanopterin S-methyltransferase subunit B